MAVTSEQLLKFIEGAVETKIERDKDGNQIDYVSRSLDDEALASALRCVADLAAHESGLAFAERQYADAHPMPQNVIPFPGPRAN